MYPGITTRQMATAYLFHEGKVLMIHKERNRLFDFSFWSGVGGHIEPDELNDPRRACLREMKEETGLDEQDLAELTLRYILLRIKETEIRQQYVYFGRTLHERCVTSAEGELHWVEADRLLELPMSTINRCMLDHYFRHPGTGELLVGTMSTDDGGQPQVQWARLEDPKVF